MNAPKKFNWLRRDILLYLLLVPGILFYILFKYWPMYGVLIAFKNYNIFEGFWASKWVGFDNFQQLFRTPNFYRIVINTFVLNMYSLVFGFPMPIIIALLLNEIKNKQFASFAQSLLYLPHFFSWVVIGGVVISILSPNYGVVNQILQQMGFKPVYFLADKNWWIFTYITTGIWKEAGWGAIIYLAALTGVDIELYEAAKIDGAGRWKQLLHITLPGIKSTIAVMLILKLGNILMIGFEHPFILSNPVVYEVSDVISTYMYTAGIQRGQFSLTTAMGLFQSLIGFVMIVTANTLIKKMGEEGIL